MTSRKATKRRRKLEVTGDCGETSYKWLMKLEGATLCHGWPLGTGGNAKGLRYWHAWLETGDGLVLELSNGHRKAIPRDLYYEAGSIDPRLVTRYTREEAEEISDAFNDFGPWVPNPYIGTGALVEDDL